MVKALIILCALALPAAATPAIAADESPLQLRILADTEGYDFDQQQFFAEGNVRVTYGDTLLTANQVSGSPLTAEIEAFGNVTFRSEDRVLTGDDFRYNYKTEVGEASNARASVDNVHFRGERLSSQPGLYIVTGSRFTTCDLDDPHFYLSARELIIRPGKKLTARRVSLVFLETRLFTIPKYSVGLGKEADREKSNLPKIGVSRQSGLHAGYEVDLSHEPATVGALDFRLSARRIFQGGVLYDRLGGQPVYLRATYRQPFYGGTRSDLEVSRLPEVGIRFSSDKSVRSTTSAVSRDLLNPLASPDSTGKFNAFSDISIGNFREEPTGVSAGRVDAQGAFWTNLRPFGSKTVISPGLSLRFSRYTGGEDYNALGFRLAAARQLGQDSYVSLSYITYRLGGNSPFEFDRVELADEVAARVRFPLRGYSIELVGRYDLRADSLYETQVSVSKVFHCFEPSISWNSRFREFSVGMNLVGF